MNKPNFERIKRPATLIKPIITSSPSPLATTSNDETTDYNSGGRQPLSSSMKQQQQSTANNGMSKLSKQPMQNFSSKPQMQQYPHLLENEEQFPPPPAALTQSYNQHSHTYQSSK
jgi:hypothetical protein